MKMRPALGVSKPASMRSSVVLPQPEPPSSANSSPLRISSETLSTAVKAPKALLTPSMRMNGSGTLSARLDGLPDPRELAVLLLGVGRRRPQPLHGFRVGID